MAKKSTMTDEERKEYLMECERAISLMEGGASWLCLSYSPESSDMGHHERTFATVGFVLCNQDTSLGEALAVLQSPKDTSDYSQEHLARWRACCRELGKLRQTCLSKINHILRNDPHEQPISAN